MPRKGKDIPLPDVPLADCLWGKCLEYGQQVAIIDNNDGETSLTFAEIYELSRNCAAFLNTKGVKVGDFICVCAPRSVEYVIAMLGIIGSGATLTLCDSAYKKNEILRQFAISEPKMVIVDETAVQTMKKVQEKMPCLETIFVIGKSDEYTTFETMCKTPGNLSFLKGRKIKLSEDIAILPCSSGTTGLPKSLMLTHLNMIGNIYGLLASIDWEQSGVVYMDGPMYHVGGFSVVFASLVSGVTLITEEVFVIEKMLKTIETYKVNWIVAAPPIMIDLANADDTGQYDTSSLISIFGGGAVMAPDIRRRLEEKFKIEVIPGYAMSESGLITAGNTVKNDIFSVGTVCANAEVKVINLQSSEECPDDEDGEVLVRGLQVMKGYLKNPEANTVAFEKGGWMRTGDIGHFDKDGKLYIVDRLKELIRYKTLQVAPAELEAVLLKHPKIADVGVIGIPDFIAGELPKAFVVRKDDGLTEQEVDEFVKSELVDYKHLRGGVEFVKAIPKSPMGKIQRKELKKMAGIKV